MDTEGAAILKLFHDMNEKQDVGVFVTSYDEVDVAIALLEGDHLVDEHVDQYKDQIRPAVLENLRKFLRTKYRLLINVKANELRIKAEDGNR